MRSTLRTTLAWLRPVLWNGMAVGAPIFAVSALCIGALFIFAHRAQIEAVRAELNRLARQAAALVDVDLHATLRDPAQMDSPEYERALRPLIDFHRTLPEVFYVYTAILDGSDIRFVLDTSNRPDLLQSALPLEPSRLMDLYKQPDPIVETALREAHPETNTEVTQDEFGAFFSGVAPFFDQHGAVVGVAGVDIDATQLSRRLAPVRRAAWLALGVALLVSGGTGCGLARFRRVALQRESQRLSAELRREQTEQVNRRLHREVALLELAEDVSRLLLDEPDFDVALPQLVPMLQGPSGADRVRFLELHRDRGDRQLLITIGCQWCRGPASQRENCDICGRCRSHGKPDKLLSVDQAVFDDWLRDYLEGREINTTVRELPPAKQRFFETQGVQALLVFPLSTGGDPAYLLAFERLHEARPFAEEDVAILRSISVTIGVSLLRKRIEQEKERNRTLLHGILHSSLDAVIALRSRRDATGGIEDFEIVLANPGAERLTRRDSAALLGARLLDVFPASRGDGLFCRLRETVANADGEGLDIEHCFGTSCAWAWCRVVAVKLQDGLAVTLSDITARKANEAELVRAKEGAEAAGRAKGEFLAVMSHEIRTPLNGVIASTTLLQDTVLSADQREHVETIRLSGEILVALISDILDFSKIEAGKIELDRRPLRLANLLENVIQVSRPAAALKNLQLSHAIDHGVPAAILADSPRLSQVLINLVGNAVKFTPAGSVQVRATPVPPAPAAGDGARIRFSITDTGIGISAETLDRLFKPFSQADSSTTRRFGGTGLGLAICKRLVQLMGGDITVESEPGRGSTFAFTIVAPPCPADLVGTQGADLFQAPPQTVTITAPATTALPFSNRPAATSAAAMRILVAEDNAVNQRIIRLVLRKLGHEAQVVSNGREAVAAWTQSDPQLVLMDIQMPELDGYEATREIRRQESLNPERPPVFICALTADAMLDDRVHCQEVGMNAYLTKPLNAQKLAALLQQVAADPTRSSREASFPSG